MKKNEIAVLVAQVVEENPSFATSKDAIEAGIKAAIETGGNFEENQLEVGSVKKGVEYSQGGEMWRVAKMIDQNKCKVCTVDGKYLTTVAVDFVKTRMHCDDIMKRAKS